MGMKSILFPFLGVLWFASIGFLAFSFAGLIIGFEWPRFIVTLGIFAFLSSVLVGLASKVM